MEQKLKYFIFTILLTTPCTNFALAESHSTEHKKPQYYTIKEDDITLSELAEVLYGRARAYKEMSAWNHLRTPNSIWVGQTLVLKQQPKIPLNQVHSKMSSFWEAHLAKRRLASKSGSTSPGRELASESDKEEAVDLSTTSPDELAKKIVLTAEQKEYATEEDIAKEKVAQARETEFDVIKIGTELNSHGMSADAIAVYERFLKTHPLAHAILKAEGDVYLKLAEFEKSLHFYEKAKSAQPTDAESWLKIMVTLKNMNADSKLVSVAHQFVENFPDLKSLPFLQKYLD